MKLNLTCETTLSVGCDTCPSRYIKKIDEPGIMHTILGTNAEVPFVITQEYTATAKSLFYTKTLSDSVSFTSEVIETCDTQLERCPNDKAVRALGLAVSLNEVTDRDMNSRQEVVLPKVLMDE